MLFVMFEMEKTPSVLSCLVFIYIIYIFMIPVFVLLFFLKDLPFNFGIAAIVFALAACTDFIDGYIARSRGLVTNLGKFLEKSIVTGINAKTLQSLRYKLFASEGADSTTSKIARLPASASNRTINT